MSETAAEMHQNAMLLRVVVNADHLASNNESYVINALQFIGIIDEKGKRIDKGHQVLLLPSGEFEKAFGDLIREAYSDLFELRAEDAWTMTKAELTAYFRTTDKTSDIIGGRQAVIPSFQFPCWK